MCGIFATLNEPKHNAAQTILKGLKTLEYRGYDSWGISVIDSNEQIKTQKKIGKIGEGTTSLPESAIGIGHTRWATHGGVTEQNAHPHLDCSGKLSLIHNGIVENYQQIKTQLIKNGHRFISETDTEVIVHLIEETMKTASFEQAVIQSFKRLEGANAILVLDAASRTVIAVKNSSPLLVGKTATSIYFSSDATAFIPLTDQIYIMEDGDVIIAHDKEIQRYSVKSGQVLPLEFKKMELSSRQIDKGKFAHFLIKEVHEQPFILNQLAKTKFSTYQQLIHNIQSAPQVVLLGCGSAYHCALFGTYFFNDAGILALAFQAHEFVAFAPNLKPGAIVIAISQSGETIDTLLACQAAKKAGAKLIGLINSRGSSLERLVDHAFPVGAGPEIAVVSTKAFLAQVSALFLLSQVLKEKDSTQGAEQLQVLADAITAFLENKKVQKQIKTLAKELVVEPQLFVIGKGLNYPAALEVALKIKETTYLHAEGFAAGELKHGVLSLIQEGTPTIVLTSQDELMQDTFSNAIEIQSRGGRIFSFSPTVFAQADLNIRLQDVGKLNAVFNIVVSQLLAYELALLKKLDPDKPRNLAKSVTVK
ncbi:MAG: glutamine--fructose-6-phosphate transaminase (isomerizing) [Patescibacteria group bacterium]